MQAVHVIRLYPNASQRRAIDRTIGCSRWVYNECLALRMLGYKCARAGKPFVKVGRFYPSSKTCSACGHVLEDLQLSVRAWECPACGASHDRDVNAARNIAAEGLRILRDSNGTAGLAGTAA